MTQRSVRSKEWKKHRMHGEPGLYTACCITGYDLTGVRQTTVKIEQVWTGEGVRIGVQ